MAVHQVEVVINPRNKPLGQHFDDDWKFHGYGEPTPPVIAEPSPQSYRAGHELSKEDVVRICREHFAKFKNLTEVAEHYGLSSGRISQVKTGIDPSCPRILKALGIKRERRTDVYRAVSNDSIPAPVPPEKPAPTTGAKESAEFIANWVRNFDHIPRSRKPRCARPKAGDLQLRKQSPGVVRVGLATRQHMLVDGECDAEYLQGLKLGGERL